MRRTNGALSKRRMVQMWLRVVTMIEVRKAVAEDAEQIAAIGIRLWERAVPHWGEDIDPLREQVHGIYRDASKDYWNTALVAVSNTVILGWVFREDMDFRVAFLNVDPDCCQRGVATALLNAVEAEIKNDGFDFAEIDLHARNRTGISFFEKSGYIVEARSTKYSTTLLKDIEKVTMRKCLERFVSQNKPAAFALQR
ncbi:MAG: GNAT family N-acetyltransferase [Pseudomonadota bacterium]